MNTSNSPFKSADGTIDYRRLTEIKMAACGLKVGYQRTATQTELDEAAKKLAHFDACYTIVK